MANLVITMTSDEAKLYRGMQKLIAQQQVLEGKLKNTGQAGRRAGQEGVASARRQEAAMNRVKSSLQGLTSQYLSVTGVIQLYNQAIQESKQIADDARRASVTVGESQMAVIKNIGQGVSDDETKAFLKSIEGVREKRGFKSVTQLNLAAADILSATGGDQKQSLEILDVASAFFKDRPDQLASFSGALGDAMAASGQDAKTTMGLLLSTFGQARFTTMEAFKNVAPVLQSAATVNQDVDALLRSRQSAALVGGLGRRMGDVEGNVTRTAVINLERRLKEIAPEGKDTFERIRIVQQDKSGQLREEILRRGGFRAQSVSAIEDLLTGGGTRTTKMVGDAFSAIETSVKSTELKIQQLANLTPELRAVTRQAKQEGAVENRRLRSREALTGEINKIVLDSINNVRFIQRDTLGVENFARRSFRRVGLNLTQGDVDAAINIVKSAIASPRDAQNPEQLAAITKQNEFLLGQIKLLEEVRNEMRQMNGRLGETGNGAAAQAEADFVQTGANL